MSSGCLTYFAYAFGDICTLGKAWETDRFRCGDPVYEELFKPFLKIPKVVLSKNYSDLNWNCLEILLRINYVTWKGLTQNTE